MKAEDCLFSPECSCDSLNTTNSGQRLLLWFVIYGVITDSSLSHKHGRSLDQALRTMLLLTYQISVDLPKKMSVSVSVCL